MAITTSDAVRAKLFIHVHSYYIQQQFPHLYRELIKASETISEGEKHYQKRTIEYKNCSIRTLQEIVAHVYTRRPHPFGKWPLPALVSLAFPRDQQRSFAELKKLCAPVEQVEAKKQFSIIKLVKNLSLFQPRTRQEELQVSPSVEHDFLHSRVLAPTLLQLNKNKKKISAAQVAEAAAAPQKEDEKLQYDLNIFIGGTLLKSNAAILKAHRLFLCDTLPFFPHHYCKNSNGTISWVAPCMLLPQSVQNVLWYVYNNYDSSSVEEILMRQSLKLLIDTTCFHKMIHYSEHVYETNFDSVIERQLNRALSCDNVATVYSAFYNDSIDLGMQLREQLQSVKSEPMKESKSGQLTSLPVEVLYIIYEFLSFEPLSSEVIAPLNERLMSQEELSFIRFSPIEFKQYLLNAAPEYLIWKSKNLSFENIRQTCVAFAANNNWNLIEKSDAYQSSLTHLQQRAFAKACGQHQQQQCNNDPQNEIKRDSIGSTPSSMGSAHFMIEEVHTMIEEQKK